MYQVRQTVLWLLLVLLAVGGTACTGERARIVVAITPESGTAPLDVQCAVSYSDNGAEMLSWFWDFGDGTSSSESNPVHTFTQAGIYTVNVAVSTAGGTELACATVVVMEGETVDVGEPEEPVAALSVSATGISIPIGEDTASLAVSNVGDDGSLLSFFLCADVPWLNADPMMGTCAAPDGTQSITLSVDTEQLALGENTATVFLYSNVGIEEIAITVCGWEPVHEFEVALTSLDGMRAYVFPEDDEHDTSRYLTPAAGVSCDTAQTTGSSLAALMCASAAAYLYEPATLSSIQAAFESSAAEFVEGCRCEGTPARAIQLWNVDAPVAPVFAEVYIDGTWHCVLPLLALFFPAADGEVAPAFSLGLNALRTSDSSAWSVWQAGASGQVPEDVAEMPGDWAAVLGSSPGDFARTCIAQASQHSILDGTRTTILPVSVTMGTETEVTIGAIDGSNADMYGAEKSGAAPYIGIRDSLGLAHMIAFADAVPGLYSVTYHFTNTSLLVVPGAAEAGACAIRTSSKAPGLWRVDLRVQKAGALLLIDLVRPAGDTTTESAGVDAITVRLEHTEADLGVARLNAYAAATTWTPDSSSVFTPVTTPDSSVTTFLGAGFTHGFVPQDYYAYSVYYHLNAEYDLDILDEALLAIFGTSSPSAPPESLCIGIMNYITQEMLIEAPDKANETYGHTGSYRLNRGYGNCYDRALVFQSLARRAGLPARITWVPGWDHVIAESFYSGAWHMFDPTFGFFFYTDAIYDGLGDIPCVQELRTESLDAFTLMRVTTNLWTGEYDGVEDIVPTASEFDSPNCLFANQGDTPVFYRETYMRSFPCNPPYFADKSFFTPIFLDFSLGDALMLGTHNSSIYDNIRALGPAIADNCINVLRFENAEPGLYAIHYVFLYDNDTHWVAPVPVRGVDVLSSDMVGTDAWRGTVWVSQPDAVLLLDQIHPGVDYYDDAYAVDAVYVERLADTAR